MRNRRIVLLLCLLLPLSGVMPQEEDTNADSGTGPDDEVESPQTTTTKEQATVNTGVPSQFIPREKITPDQVISFPADI